MKKQELAYVVYLKVWEDTPKVRHDIEKRLRQMCELAFADSEVADANGDGCADESQACNL